MSLEVILCSKWSQEVWGAQCADGTSYVPAAYPSRCFAATGAALPSPNLHPGLLAPPRIELCSEDPQAGKALHVEPVSSCSPGLWSHWSLATVLGTSFGIAVHTPPLPKISWSHKLTWQRIISHLMGGLESPILRGQQTVNLESPIIRERLKHKIDSPILRGQLKQRTCCGLFPWLKFSTYREASPGEGTRPTHPKFLLTQKLVGQSPTTRSSDRGGRGRRRF